MDEIDLESLEEELANLDPEDLRYLSKLIAEDTPTVQRVINTLLDEPIPEAAKKKLKAPLKPLKPLKPTPKPHQETEKETKRNPVENIRPHPTEQGENRDRLSE